MNEMIILIGLVFYLMVGAEVVTVDTIEAVS